jgi:subtilisin-like proprotein convertase family protein
LNVAKAVAGSGPDVTGPRVTSSVWLGSGNSVNQVQFTFSEAIAAGTFTTADISSFTGPGGTNLLSQVTGVTGSGATWTVSFNTQTAVGSYSMTIGPDILDTASPGNKMDQNGNGVNGEAPGDRYTSTYSLDGTYTFSSTDVPKNIYDLQTTVSLLTINQDITIKDLNVKFYVTHTWDSDLRIRLRAPDNTLLTLVQYRGGSGDNFGNSTTYCTIDDEATTAISSGVAPFAGSYRPEVGGELWRLDNKNARGTWKLEIYDSANLDTGMLRAWQLVITANNGGAGKKSIAAGEGDLFNLPIERNRPMSFVSTSPSGSSVRSDDDDVRAAAAEGTELRAVNHFFAEPGPLFTNRHSTSSDPLAALFEGNTDLTPL